MEPHTNEGSILRIKPCTISIHSRNEQNCDGDNERQFEKHRGRRLERSSAWTSIV